MARKWKGPSSEGSPALHPESRLLTCLSLTLLSGTLSEQNYIQHTPLGFPPPGLSQS